MSVNFGFKRPVRSIIGTVCYMNVPNTGVQRVGVYDINSWLPVWLSSDDVFVVLSIEMTEIQSRNQKWQARLLLTNGCVVVTSVMRIDELKARIVPVQ